MNTSKSFLKKIRISVLAIALISITGTVFTLPTYAVAPFDVTVSDFSQLQTAVETSFAAATDDMVITVSAPISITTILTVPAPATGGKSLTIKGSSPSITLTRGVTGNLITIVGRATLILENIIIDGAKNGGFSTDGGGSLVRLAGNLQLRSGAVLQNNVFAGDFGYGAGLHSVSGTLTLTGGKIIGNTAGSKGGGVYSSTGVFTMIDGEISGNSVNGQGGGVLTYDTEFTLNGGEISGNTCVGQGGGVYSISPSVISPLVQNGGKISGNSATFGGGIFMTETPYDFNGGEISGNSADDGGGIFMQLSVLTQNGGKISNNSAKKDGGGVFVYSEAYIMSGGEIIGNSAANNGGGVCIPANSYNVDFELSGSVKISDNKQSSGAKNNVYLTDGRYIMFGPARSGMSVGVKTATASGIIVAANATEADAAFFSDDDNGKVVFEGSQLKITK